MTTPDNPQTGPEEGGVAVQTLEERAREWARTPEALDAIRKSTESGNKMASEIDRARRIDPRSLRDPITI